LKTHQARFIHFNTPPYAADPLYLKMSSLLQIASRVEAAVEAYTSVWDFADREVWKSQFEIELVSVHLHGN